MSPHVPGIFNGVPGVWCTATFGTPRLFGHIAGACTFVSRTCIPHPRPTSPTTAIHWLANMPRPHFKLALILLLAALPRLTLANDSAVLYAIDLRKWSGRGIGWIDAHLLTSALVTQTPLWTLDRRLHGLAAKAGAAWINRV